MKKRRSIIALSAVLFAAALLALPGGAWASTTDDSGRVHLTQSDFVDNRGYYERFTLHSGTTYVLDEDVTGFVEATFSLSDSRPESFLDLDGHTITGIASEGSYTYDRSVITLSGGTKITISNGNLVQANPDQAVVRTDGSSTNLTLNLGNAYSATSTNHMCIDAEDGTVTIESGTFENKNSDGSGSGKNAEVLRAGANGSVVVNGGTIRCNGSSPIASTLSTAKSSVILNAGSFNAYPEGASALGANKALHAHKYPNQLFYVDDSEAVKKGLDYYVATGSDVFGDVAFETEAEAKQFASDLGLEDSAIGTYAYTVNFDTNGGTPETIDSIDSHYGRTVSEPSGVTKDGYKLLGWTYDTTGALYDFSSTLTGDLTLTAKWFNVVAKIGDVEYESLQSAINAAGNGDTVILCKDWTESVDIPAGGKLTLDLGGHTLTGADSDGAIELTGKRELVIKNGTVVASKDDCLLLTKDSAGSVVTLGGEDAELALQCTSTISNDNAVCVQGNSTVNFGKGSYTSGGNCAVLVFGSAGGSLINITDGSFSSAGDNGDTVRANSGSITISGGNIAGHAMAPNTGSTITITGGTFGDDTNRADIDADEYHMLQNSDGKYVVSAHEKKLVVDVKPTATTDGSGHYECDVDGCDWKTEASSEKIPAGSDVDAPVIAGLAAGAAYDVSKTFTVADASDFTVTVDGEEIAKNLDGSFTLPFGEKMTVVATDKWGNTSSVASVSNYKDHDWTNPVGDKDGEHHTYTCAHSACEVKTKQESHTGGTATCKTKAACDVCGASYGELDPSNHEGAVSSGYSYDDNNHWRTYTCCGVEVSGTVHEHELEVVVVKQPTETEDGLQYDKCKDCAYRGADQVIPATGGAPVIDGLVNGGSYDLEDDKPTFTVTAPRLKEVTVNGEVVTPSEEGVYTLLVAGDSVEVVATDNNGKSTTVTVSCYETHDWGDWQGNGNGTHYRNCKHTGCEGHQDRDCNGGAATCVSRAVCADCGLEYGTINPDNHTGSSTWHHSDDEHWKTCDSCGNEIADSRAEYSTKQCYDESEHWDSCECGYESEHVKHSLVQKSDESGHWQECSDCDYATTKEGHAYEWVVDKEATATEDGHRHQECTTCGYKNGVEEIVPKTGGDSSDDDDKGGDSDKKDDKKDDAKKLPATGDPALVVSGLATAGAVLTALGFKRRK